jgi:membrane-anchored protein YejM (alkaline phosphatase superfamily)
MRYFVFSLTVITNLSIPLTIFLLSFLAPLQVPKAAMDRFSFIEDPRRQAYAAKAWWVDNAVGDVVDALKNRGMWNNTAFFLTADNVSQFTRLLVSS